VFGVTSVVSVLAYLWIWVVLEGTSPQQVDLLEGMLTLAMLGVLVVAAFLVDKGWLWHACARARPAVAEVFGPAGVEDEPGQAQAGQLPWAAQKSAGRGRSRPAAAVDLGEGECCGCVDGDQCSTGRGMVLAVAMQGV
ncbi:unnamed protein product, partial [Prorocentrum cordatum]